MRDYEQLGERYKEAHFFEQRHVEASEQFLQNHSRYSAQKLASENMVTYHLGGRAFELLVHTPPDPSDQAIVVPTGYAMGIGTYSALRAMAIRELVDPHATLIVQGNMSPAHTVNNFSAHEEGMLMEGDFAPMRDRLNVVLEALQAKLPDVSVAYSGGSLGAAVVGAVLGSANTMVLPTNGGTIIDPANIAERSVIDLGAAFAVDLTEMSRVGMENFTRDWWLQGWRSKEKHTFKKASVQLEAGKMAVREGIFLALALGHNQLSSELSSAPKDVGIVHLWSQNSHISPDRANQSITDTMTNTHPLYESIKITDAGSRHGVTVSYGLVAAALEHSMRLSEPIERSVQ